MKYNQNIKNTSFAKQWLSNLLCVVLLAVCMMIGTAMAGNNSASTTTDPSFVGFWHVELHLTNGSLWYQSIQQCHEDGLEMEDAAMPPLKPAHVCMGVWKQDGNIEKVYHIIWMYNGTDTKPVDYAVLTETNKLSDDANSFTGTFNVEVHNIKNGKLVKTIKGTTTARRIDFDHPFSLFSN